MEIGLLRERRKELGLTQTELAKRIGMCQNSISMFENQEKYPSVNSMLKLAEELSLTVDEIMEDYKAKERR